MEVLFVLSDDWNNETGGISSFNFDLVNSISLGIKDFKDYMIVCICNVDKIEIPDKFLLLDLFSDKNSLNYYGIYKKLSELLKKDFKEVKETYKASWWIGHDVITGQDALKIQNEYNEITGHSSKFAFIHHMCYEDYYYLKLEEPINQQQYNDKIKMQDDLISKANLVFAVGPKLYKHAKNNSDSVVEIIPGIQKIEKKTRISDDKPTLITTLIGRFDEKEEPIKQQSLAVEALEKYYTLYEHSLSYESSINVYGVSKKLSNWGNKIKPFNALTREDIYKEISKSNIGFLVSSHEGFGLVGWEFISAGIPLILAQDTGLYLFLKNFLSEHKLSDEILINSVELKQRESCNTEEKNNLVLKLQCKIEETVNNLVFYNKQAEILKKELSTIYTWENTAAIFINALDLNNKIHLDGYMSRNNESNYQGIEKLTNNDQDRIADFKKCLTDAYGEIFISGTSMIHLTEDSATILERKIVDEQCSIKLLLMDPEWAKDNSSVFTFHKNKRLRELFCLEIENSIEKLNEIKNNLPQNLRDKLQIRRYKTFFPYILTGYESLSGGKMVCEITDYLNEPQKLRISASLIHEDECLYKIIKSKYNSLWNNESLTIRE